MQEETRQILVILWFGANQVILLGALSVLVIQWCRNLRYTRPFMVGMALIFLLMLRRLNTLLIELLPNLPHTAQTTNKYVWPTMISFVVLFLALETNIFLRGRNKPEGPQNDV